MMASSVRTLSRSLCGILLLPMAVAGWLGFPAIPAALAAQGGSSAPNTLASGVQPGPPPALTIFYTDEVIGWTEPCG